METIILSVRNCHRAATVRQVNNENAPVLEFKYKGKMVRTGFLRNEYSHIAGEDIEIGNYDKAMKDWEVVSWKYEENFEDMYNVAVRAFEGTSFSPEERAISHIRMYENALQEDLKQIPAQAREQYYNKFKEWVRILFDKHSRILSEMITGPARFPTARNEKANNSYSKALEDFESWRDRAIKSINRKEEDAKPIEQKNAEEWERIKRDIDSNIKSCVDIDNGAPFYRSAFVNSIYGKIERLAKSGKMEFVLKSIDYIKQVQDENKVGLKKPVFTSRHKIWQLKEVCESAIQKKQEEKDKGNDEIKFDGGVVVKNREEDRLQILFDEKPDAETISKLKHNGFRWSPRFKAWQRQLTNNAYYACARVINVSLENLAK